MVQNFMHEYQERATMTELELYQKIQAAFPEAIVELKEPAFAPPPEKKDDTPQVKRPKPLAQGPCVVGYIEVKPEVILDLLSFLKNTPELDFDMPHCISGVDYKSGEDLGVTYSLTSIKYKHWVNVKVRVPRENPVLKSCVAMYPGMDWHEREAFDLLGVIFDGHPNLRRILCADDWEGYPLRKDYEFPEFYHGIPTDKEVRWNS